MSRRVLIANRGEIAIRIAKALIDAGFTPLGIYTKKDSSSLHRKYMVEDAEVSSYLDVKEIIEAAIELGAEAIHPGYGFLSENVDFAREVARKGLIFIGPPPNILELSGDKIAVKSIAEKLGIPTLPWMPVKDVKDVMEFIRENGLPAIIKAAGGGGGKGIRVITRNDEKEIEKALEAASKEAKSAFNDDRLYIEKFVNPAKHLEVQVMGDGDNIIHLYERECSIQKNMQKLVEEAPSPSISEKERKELLEYALTFAYSVRYQNIGTVEFLFDVQNRSAYLMEVNARIQVEHPVTEMVTAIDIVRKQVEIAFYKVLDIRQENVVLRGHSIEARVQAVNPLTWSPASGVVKNYVEPTGPGVRVDSGIATGSRILPDYDPLVAKVIVWGYNRQLAVSRLRRALSEYLIDGVPTNIPLLKGIVSHPEFVNATHTTDFLERNYDGLREKILEELRLHAAISAFLAEKKPIKTRGEEKSLVEKQPVIPQEASRQLKRTTWYYYITLRNKLHRRRK